MRLSLGTKITLMLIIFAALLSGVSITVCNNSIHNMVIERYTDLANDLAATAATVIDADAACELADAVMDTYAGLGDPVMSSEWGEQSFDDYVENYAKLRDKDAYATLLAELRALQDANDVNCFYLVSVDGERDTVVYVVDADEDEPCPVGCVDPLFEENAGVVDDPERGFPAYVTDTEEYGWLVSAGVAVHDKAGHVGCYAMVDISMDEIMAQQNRVVSNLTLALVVLTVILCLVAALLAHRFISRPLTELSEAAERYLEPGSEHHASFGELSIRTHDEIEQLYGSMVQMEQDLDAYVEHLVSAQAELRYARLEAELMSGLALTDALTGIRNKLAYDREIAKVEAACRESGEPFGIALVDLNDLKGINDTYGHERGDIAIKTLATDICETFAHSPVFRVGGDEFVVILRGHDLDCVDALTDEFLTRSMRRLRSSIAPWERASAAIGYSVFDATRDASARDVQRRADREMYRMKTTMKGGNVR